MKQPKFSSGFEEMVSFLTDLVQTGTAMQDLLSNILNEKIKDFENFESTVRREKFSDKRKQVSGNRIYESKSHI